ncbi:hypothetical protein HGRIS_000062 [Hohenbuehelia grisea]|uniref:Uncharacterized protein n=1 Tax=Hohenbuehelia grisea TaxID=104357 RepID=A0ABR3JRG7_9AGAR
MYQRPAFKLSTVPDFFKPEPEFPCHRSSLRSPILAAAPSVVEANANFESDRRITYDASPGELGCFRLETGSPNQRSSPVLPSPPTAQL